MIRKTVRVRRGLQRASMVLQGDIETISTDQAGYRAHGMTKSEWDDYLLAIDWIAEQARAASPTTEGREP